MRNAYLAALYELAKKNPRILAAVADNGAIVYDKFRADFPEQFINFGIAEATMVTVCAGLASCGKIPFAYTIIPFLTMRAYEQVRNDVCLQRQNVKLVGVGGGLAYSTLGPTHHATEDIAVMRVLPHMTVIVPATPIEAYQATIAAAQIDGPVYIRLEATKEPEIFDNAYNFKVDQGVVLHDGNDATVIAAGSIVYDVLQVALELENQNIKIRVIDLHTIKPMDRNSLLKAVRETGAILTVEEHSISGGLGGAVAEVLLENGNIPVIFERMGLVDEYAHGYGSRTEIKAMNGLSQAEIMQKLIQMVKRKNN